MQPEQRTRSVIVSRSGWRSSLRWLSRWAAMAVQLFWQLPTLLAGHAESLIVSGPSGLWDLRELEGSIDRRHRWTYRYEVQRRQTRRISYSRELRELRYAVSSVWRKRLENQHTRWIQFCAVLSRGTRPSTLSRHTIRHADHAVARLKLPLIIDASTEICYYQSAILDVCFAIGRTWWVCYFCSVAAARQINRLCHIRKDVSPPNAW